MQHLEHGDALYQGGHRAHRVVRGACALVERHEVLGDSRGHPDGREATRYLEECEEGRGRGRAPAGREVRERAVEYEYPARGGEHIVGEEVRLYECSRGAGTMSATTANFFWC